MDICIPSKPPCWCRCAHSTSPVPGQSPPRLHQWICNPPQLLCPPVRQTVSKPSRLPKTEFLLQHWGEGHPMPEGRGGLGYSWTVPTSYRPQTAADKPTSANVNNSCKMLPEVKLGSVLDDRPVIKPTPESCDWQSREGWSARCPIPCSLLPGTDSSLEPSPLQINFQNLKYPPLLEILHERL